MTMMPRGRGQNDAAVKSHPRRCSERHKEEDAAACPRLLCANTKYIILLLSRLERRKSEGGGAAARASCDDVMTCLEHTHNKRVSVHKKNKEKERERERRKTLSLSHTVKSKKVCVFETVLCPHEKCTDRSHVWFKTTPLFFRPKFFLSLSLSTKNTLFKTLNDILREEKTKKNLGKKKVETFGRGGGALLL